MLQVTIYLLFILRSNASLTVNLPRELVSDSKYPHCISPKGKYSWHHELTCGEEAPVGVEREAGDGGGRLQLEDVVRPVAERVAELARPHAQPSLPAPLKLLVLGRHDVHLQSPAFSSSIKAGAFVKFEVSQSRR